MNHSSAHGYTDNELPPNFRLGKEKSNGLMVGGLPVFAGVAQIFLRCNGSEKKCHETNCVDEVAAKIFDAHGWLVKGYNNKHYSRCPVCRLKIKRIKN